MSKYDRIVVSTVAFLSLLVVFVLLVFVQLFNISTVYLLMPAGWWVGAMMVWAYGKFGPVAQR